MVARGLTGADWPKVWHHRELRRSYDVVIIGGGLHGLATAYYLAMNHGIRDIAVLDRGYLGGGGSGRNTSPPRGSASTTAR
jgi:sarcosine oxidase subunit beta